MNFTYDNISNAIKRSVKVAVISSILFQCFYSTKASLYTTGSHFDPLVLLWNTIILLINVVLSATAFITLIKGIGNHIFLSALCFVLPPVVFFLFTLNYFVDNRNPDENLVDYLAVGITHLAYIIGMAWQFIKIVKRSSEQRA